MRLKGKTAIVTGAGSGFGEGIATTFAREGANVVVADINEAGGKRVADSINGAGGRAVVPMSGQNTGLLPNRRFILWPYARLNDSRIVFTESEVVVNQGDGPTPYKFGSDNEAGWAAYSNHGDTFIKRYTSVPGGTYPDFGVSFELYTNNLMLELETLGELQEVESGDTLTHVETWRVVKGLDLKQGTEQEAVAKLQPYVK